MLKFIHDTFHPNEEWDIKNERRKKKRIKRNKGKNTELRVVKKKEPEIVQQENIEKLVQYKKKTKLKNSVKSKLHQ